MHDKMHDQKHYLPMKTSPERRTPSETAAVAVAAASCVSSSTSSSSGPLEEDEEGVSRRRGLTCE